MNIKFLRDEWLFVATQWSAEKELAAVIFEDLCTRYGEKKRHYHTLKHVSDMLRLARKNKGLLNSWEPVFFAVWFHDAIQEMFVDSELKSAELCRTSLKTLKVPGSVIEEACNMILATKGHQYAGETDLGFFLDLDLAVLGSHGVVYRDYQHRVRAEYSVPNWLYNRGRRKFLKEKLSASHLFNQPVFVRQFNYLARLNMSQELECLEGVV